MWATGIILHEMLLGTHPIWMKDKDNRTTYREKLNNLAAIDFDSKIKTFPKYLN